jgi:hypothetical protein
MPSTGNTTGPPIRLFGETGPEWVAVRKTSIVAPGTKEVTFTCCEHWPVGTIVGGDKVVPLSPLIGYLWLMVISPLEAEGESKTIHTSGEKKVRNQVARRLNIRVLLVGKGCPIDYGQPGTISFQLKTKKTGNYSARDWCEDSSTTTITSETSRKLSCGNLRCARGTNFQDAADFQRQKAQMLDLVEKLVSKQKDHPSGQQQQVGESSKHLLQNWLPGVGHIGVPELYTSRVRATRSVEIEADG